MILHLAVFTFRDETTAAQVADLGAALTEMAADLGHLLVSYAHGPGLGLTPGGADYGVAARVRSEADLRDYLDSPQHRAVGEGHLAGMLATRHVVQLDVTGEATTP